MPSIADTDREFWLGAVTGSSALMTNSDLERAYYLQMLGLTNPSPLTNADLKYKFLLANVTGGNASMSVSDLERMYEGDGGTPPVVEWTPADLGPIAWYDADDASSFTYTSGVIINQWKDKSGNGIHIENSVGTRPTRDGSINSRTAVKFNGGQFIKTAAGHSLTKPHTLLVVARNSATSGAMRICTVFTNEGRIAMAPSGNVFVNQGDAGVDTGIPWGTTSAKSVGVIFNMFDSHIAVNSNTWGPAYFLGYSASDDLTVGGHSGATDFWNGVIGEIVSIPRAITEAELAQWNAYCTAKWIPAVAPSFDPLAIPNCSLWLDATDPATLTLSGSNVTAWRDKSTKGVVLPAANGYPLSGTRTINGKNAIEFNLGGTLFKQAGVGGDINNPTNGAWTIFAAALTDNVAGTKMIITSGNQNVGQYIRQDNTYLGSIAYAGGAITDNIGPNVVQANTPFIARTINAGFPGSIEVFYNGTGDGSVALAGAQTYAVDTHLSVGGYGTGFPWDGLIGEVIAYSRVLTAPEITQVEDYLRAKWIPPTLLWDDFNRSDRPIDAPITGNPPSARNGGWTIVSNQFSHGPGQLQDANVMWNVGATSYTLTTRMVVKPGDGGVVVRGPSAGYADYILVNLSNWIMYSKVSGNFTSIATGVGTPASGDLVTVVVTPTSINVTCAPSGATMSATNSEFAAATWVGFRANGDTSMRFDDLRVT